MHHELKIDLPYYEAAVEGRKPFEIRYNDRGYNAGDTITMTAFDGVHKLESKKIHGRILYVTAYMQQPNYVVFSYEQIERGEVDG